MHAKADVTRQSAIGNRQSAIGNRQSALASLFRLKACRIAWLFAAVLLPLVSHADTPETTPDIAPLHVLISNGGAELGILNECKYAITGKEDLSGAQGCYQNLRSKAGESTCSGPGDTAYSNIAATSMSWDRFSYTATKNYWSNSFQECRTTAVSGTWGGNMIDDWCDPGYLLDDYDTNGNNIDDFTRCISLSNNPTNGCDPSEQCCETSGATPTLPPANPSSEPKVKPRDTRRSGNQPGLGDPVDLRNGNVFTAEVDVEFPGSALRFLRYYNSGDRIYDPDTGALTLAYQLGNWRGEHMATQAMVVSNAASGGTTTHTAIVTRPDGRSLRYTTTGSIPAPGAWTTTERTWQLSGIYDGAGAWTGLALDDGTGLREIHDTSGRLLQVQSSGITILQFTRDAGTGRVTTITDQFGNYLNFAYHTTPGLLDKLAALYVNTPTSGTAWATYTYETAVGPTRYFLKQVTYANSTTRSYHYEDADYPRGLSRVVNENGDEETRWDYAASGRALGNAMGGGVMSPALNYVPPGQGAPTTTTLNTPEGTVTVLGTWTWEGTKLIQTLGYTPSHPDTQTDISLTESFPNGLVNTFETAPVNGEYRVTRKTRDLDGDTADYLTEYDAAGNITRTTDWNGSVTTHTYNARHLETSRTEGAETTSARTTTTEWHATLKLPTKITTPTTETLYTYVGGKVKTRTETDLTGFNAGSRSWTYHYGVDDAGTLLTSLVGPLGDTTTWAYSTQGRLLSVTRPGNLVTIYEEHNLLGQPTTVTDPNNVVTQLTYDARGRLLSSTRQDAAQGNPAVTYTRDGVGRITAIQQAGGTAASPTTRTTTLVRNAAGDIAEVIDATGARAVYDYDDEGNISQIDVLRADNTSARQLLQSWDGLQRPTTLTSPGTVNPVVHADYTYDHNDNLTRTENGAGLGDDRVYDALDRLASNTDAAGGQTGFTYDSAGNLASVTDAVGRTTTYAYDGFGCLREQNSPDTGLTTFTCDKAGNVTSRTDARGTITFARDTLGRLSSRNYLSAPGELAVFTYDDMTTGNLGKGHLTGAGNDIVDVAFFYDAAGNLTQQSNRIPPTSANPVSTQYAYNRADELTTLTYPSGRTVTYTRDTAGQITGITTKATPASAEQTIASDITWEAMGGLKSLTYGNGTTETRDYDASGRLETLVTGGVTRAYGYDAAGRIEDITDGDPARSEGYTYDNVDRVLNAALPNGGNRAYEYDAIGNRTATTIRYQATGELWPEDYDYDGNSRLTTVEGTRAQTFTYDAVGNTLSKVDNIISYDAQGNQILTPDATLTFTYNAAGRLNQTVAVKDGVTKTYTYSYNALGERVKKTGPGSTTYFHYDPQGRLLAEHNASGAVVREYIWLGNKPVGQIAKPIEAGLPFQLYAVHSDHLDTALRLTDSTGSTAWQYSREPYGLLVNGSRTVRWMLRFPGQYADDETGFHYNYFRDYDPQTGRYIESDPIGLEGGINTYAYALGSPVSNVDPDGLNPYVAIRVIVAVGAKAVAACKSNPRCRKAVEDFKDDCSKLECKLARERADHRKGFPGNQFHEHYRLTCWIPGKGRVFDHQWPLPNRNFPDKQPELGVEK